MAFHFCAHPWEVCTIDDGTLIALSNRDLSTDVVSVLADELYEIACEADHASLSLDFERIGLVSSLVIAKMVVLSERLREIGGRLRVINVNPALYDVFVRTGLHEMIAIQRR